MKTSCSCAIPIRIYGNENYNKCTRCNKIIKNKTIMKTSKMLELVENLKVGERVIIEQFEDHLFIEKKLGNRISSEWTPAPSDNVNIHGVDLSILNEEDWFYVETSLFKYLFKGDMLNENRRNLTYSHHRGSLDTTGIALCDKDDIALLRKATPEDLAPFFEEYPQYAPVKDGDIGIFYDDLKEHQEKVEVSDFNLGSLKGLNDGLYPYISRYHKWKHFFKVHESETIAEIKERFLKENKNEG